MESQISPEQTTETSDTGSGKGQDDTDASTDDNEGTNVDDLPAEEATKDAGVSPDETEDESINADAAVQPESSDDKHDENDDDDDDGDEAETNAELIRKHVVPEGEIDVEDAQTLQEIMSQMEVMTMEEAPEEDGDEDEANTNPAGEVHTEDIPDDNTEHTVAQAEETVAEEDNEKENAEEGAQVKDIPEEEEKQNAESDDVITDETKDINTGEDDNGDAEDDDDDEYQEDDLLSGTVLEPIREFIDVNDHEVLQELMSQMETFELKEEDAPFDGEEPTDSVYDTPQESEPTDEHTDRHDDEEMSSQGDEADENKGENHQTDSTSKAESNDAKDAEAENSESDDDDDHIDGDYDDDDDDEPDEMDEYFDQMSDLMSPEDSQALAELVSQMSVMRLQEREQEEEDERATDGKDNSNQQPTDQEHSITAENNIKPSEEGQDEQTHLDESSERNEEATEYERFDINAESPQIAKEMSPDDQQLINDLVQTWQSFDTGIPPDESSVPDNDDDIAPPEERESDDVPDMSLQDEIEQVATDPRFIFSDRQLDQDDRSSLSELMGNMDLLAMPRGESREPNNEDQDKQESPQGKIETTSIPPFVLDIERRLKERYQQQQLNEISDAENDDEQEGKEEYSETDDNGERLLPPFCTMPAETGPCRARQLKWFYNPSTGRCEEFFWGGCAGNANRFNSRERCKKICCGKSSMPGLVRYAKGLAEKRLSEDGGDHQTIDNSETTAFIAACAC